MCGDGGHALQCGGIENSVDVQVKSYEIDLVMCYFSYSRSRLYLLICNY